MKTQITTRRKQYYQWVIQKSRAFCVITGSLLILFSVSSVLADADLDPNTNNVTVDDPTSQADIDLANQLLDYEQAADTIENAIEDAAGYGEEPYAPDPENPDEWLTGNEYIEEVIGQDNVDSVDEWREFFPEEPWAS